MMKQRTATRILQMATAMAFLALPVLANAVVGQSVVTIAIE